MVGILPGRRASACHDVVRDTDVGARFRDIWWAGGNGPDGFTVFTLAGAQNTTLKEYEVCDSCMLL